MAKNKIFGIDLGTTNSLIAFWDHGKVNVLANEYGETTTPSCPITEGKHPKFKVVVDDSERQISPEEVAAIILTKLKDIATARGQQVKDVVITVPAYFSEDQRNSTKIAGEMVGLNVLKIIPEPVAAALAFGFASGCGLEGKVLVYDLGGGTFDIAIVDISSTGCYHVLSTNGNTHLGSANFIGRLMNYTVKRLGKETHATMLMIRTACEKAIKQLSSVESAEINIGDNSITITRGEYERMISGYVASAMECVKNALHDADVEKDEISKVVLVGGCSQTPFIRTCLKDFFEKDLSTEVNPMEAIAHGACIYGAVLKKMPGAPNMYLRNSTPLTIGLVGPNKVCTPLIPRNTPFPVEEPRNGCTSKDNQQRARFEVFEGENLHLDGNTILGSMCMEGIHPAPKHEEKFKVWLKINEDGVISARTKYLRSNEEKELVIDRPNKFTSEELAQMSRWVAQLQRDVQPSSSPLVSSQPKKKRSRKGSKLKKRNIEASTEEGEEVRCPIYGGGLNAMNCESSEFVVED
ncbi:chaperone protein DnaK-like [Sitodiplosis mosellana]|uniref:chaperone protein DnaK-like n=1 Tax=Sitodiplosis mosellana TaxID=263140 RepID=UPI002444209D|nr:chaperone protein DnaK-like [Sitodiplosis mosellana]